MPYCVWYGKYLEDVEEYELEFCEENGQNCMDCSNLVSKGEKD